MHTDLLLLRHGQTEWNLLHRIQGSVDIPLNEQGLAQARATRDAMHEGRFDGVVTSHLDRAIVTAQTINNPHGKPMALDERLAERAHGRYEGWTVQDVVAEVGEAHADEFFQHSSELEAWSMVTDRVMSALRDIEHEYRGGTALVVSHGGAIRAAVASIRGVHHRSLPGLQNCSITRLRYTDEWTVLDYNDVEHLPEALRS